jgi:hypothetical protein
MSDPSEALNVNKKIIPVQLGKGNAYVGSAVPCSWCAGRTFLWLKFLFFGGLMFVYADFCSAIPFSNTLEGLIYMKPEFVKRKVFWTIQMEAVIYSLLFGLAASWLLI